VGVVVRFLRGETITVLREHRDPTTGISTLAADRSISGCGWAPVGQETNDPSRERVESRRSLFTPPQSGLKAGERVQFADGSMWEVTVDADVWRHPMTGWAPGDHVALTRVVPSL
jgi:hypothetical protein